MMDSASKVCFQENVPMAVGSLLRQLKIEPRRENQASGWVTAYTTLPVRVVVD